MRPTLLSGAVQVRIFAPEESHPSECIQNWSIPGWVFPMASPSVGWGLKGTSHPTVLHKRIADQMGIVDGDEIEVEFVEYGAHCVLPVHVQDGLSAPFLINGMFRTGYLESMTMDNNGDTMVFKDGIIVRSGMQSFWSGMRVVSSANHVVILTFDGCCKNNPEGPSGYGFAIHRGKDDTDHCSMGDLLVQRYGYSPSGGSSNRMEYAGLTEGLHWAKLVHTRKIIVRGDSELVI
jgi:hypothetical protein